MPNSSNRSNNNRNNSNHNNKVGNRSLSLPSSKALTALDLLLYLAICLEQHLRRL